MIPLNTTYSVLAPAPLDSRNKVATYSELALIPVKYVGLITYVADENKDYRYYATGWQLYTNSGTTAAVWGSITGAISAQADLGIELGKKFNKAGGTITGAITVLNTTEATNFILSGSENSSEFGRYAEVVATPVSTFSPGVVNQIAYDANFAYFCIATNTWVRTPLGPWI